MHSTSFSDTLADELLPNNNAEQDNSFLSMEISKAKPKKLRNFKREARPFLNLLMDILDTLYTSNKAQSKRSQFRESRYTR